jgi:hypothetical protein
VLGPMEMLASDLVNKSRNCESKKFRDLIRDLLRDLLFVVVVAAL